MKKTANERMAICETKLDEVLNKLNNHLSHHWYFTMVLLSAIVTEAIAFLVLVVRHVFAS